MMITMHRSMKLICAMLLAVALIASAVIPAAAVTTSEYSEGVSYTDASHAKVTFESYVSSTYVYVHYKVDNGQDMHYLMSQSGNTWTYDIGGLNANDVVSYWFTYQIGTTQKDTTHWGFSYTHTSQSSAVATPTFTPPAGTYSSAQTVTIASATSGATIHYTTNGANPTTGSSVYSGPITVSSSMTLKAIAVKAGMSDSAVASASYTINNNSQQVATPTFTPAAGTYGSAQTVTIASATSGATIHYTTNGANPTTGSSVYSGPITVSSSMTLKALAVKSGMTASNIASASYTIGSPNTGLEKFEPADGKTMIAVGQTKGEMDAYQALADIPDPAGYMIYTSITDAGGMLGPVDKGAGVNDFQHWASTKSNSVAQIGLDMANYDASPPGQQEIDRVVAGQRDASIATIATAIKNSGKPVFVRIGYEADSPWNHYEAATYIKAYRYVHDKFRELEVDNAAFVWSLVGYPNAGGPAPYHAPVPIESWYPGDEYVDWVAISWFGWPTAADEASAEQSRQDAVSFANNHNKPLMIGEATPRTYNNMLLTNPSTWDNYFQKMFDFIEANNVKMLSYINQDWSVQPIFSDPMWGDSRIQQAGASYIYNKWKTELADARYLHASSSLYGAIGFDPNAPSKPVVPRPVHSLPGKVEAENWADAWSVFNTPLSSGSNPNNMALCWLSSNSTMSYQTNASAAGNRNFSLRIANGSGSPTSAVIKVHGNTVATVTIPTTADWDTYTTAVSSPVNLAAGQHTITIQAGGTFNFDWFEVN